MNDKCTQYNVRQFRHSLKEALDNVDVGINVHISRGDKMYEVIKCTHTLENLPAVKNHIADHKEFIEKHKPTVSTYGCGCEREEGNPLCSKHGRL